ncbi:uncharacterized protein LOC115764717 [Drosophila novamexicana]|uniref:uncharacterized protein LOC115764717 n=1 Tax=Drosophila novamexicana TaxID=47314 RepID=UPI0011E5DE64|nr:uncharacterized protein LOC115764717 [Drosophila novamexicana]
MEEDQPKQTKVCFLFDIIVTRLRMYKDKIDNPQSLAVNVRFNKMSINVTASRINVSEFQSGRRIEFSTEPDTMRQNLEADGLPIVVRYSGLSLGNARIKFPQNFIDSIEDGMSDQLHADTCSIERRGVEVGTIEILCILIAKCLEQAEQPEPCNKSCGNLARAINAADIMFVVGDPDPCPKICEPCADELEQEEGDEQLKLDLNRYPSLNQRVTKPPTREICGTEACCQLQAITKHYGEIIESVVKNATRLTTSNLNKDLVITDWSGKQRNFPQKYVDRSIAIPTGDIDEFGIKSIRFCPVCLTPMSWLPKYFPCPKCCTKAMPQIETIPGEKLTADQIMNEFLRLPAKSVEDDEKEPDVSKRCTCKNNIVCTHCRIRNLCAYMLKPRVHQEKCPSVTPDQNEDFCVVVESEVCRPYLERVFGELRDLYGEREANKTAELQKRSKPTLGPKETVDLAKKALTGAIQNAHSSPSYLQRTSNGPKIGHKTCLRPQPFVSRRHGWAWPSTKKARKYGWRPGAICRYAGTVMRFFLQYSRDNNAFNTCRRAERPKRKQLPILNVCKRNGAIYITLRAVNNPHIEMKPIVFRIVKSDLAVALREIKKKLKDKGYRKCVCHKTVMLCVCRKMLEKKNLEEELQKECKRRGMENCVDHLVLTDTSDSEVEFDFDVTPPAGVAKPQLSVKPRTVTLSTQTNPKDKAPPKYPIEVGPYWRAYDCAAGDRYTGTAFGRPGEAVFEDGIFGYGGGGPHGPYATPGGRAKTHGIWGASPGGPLQGGGRVGDGKRGSPGGKSFPGDKKKPTGPSAPIPVRMPKRYIEALKNAAQAEKDAVQNEIDRKKRGIDLMQYLMKHDAIPTPWNPNEPKPKVKTKTGPVVGPDGLTDAQRKRRALNQICIPPFESLARLGKGYDPCTQCYSPCAQWCPPCSYYC